MGCASSTPKEEATTGRRRRRDRRSTVGVANADFDAAVTEGAASVLDGSGTGTRQQQQQRAMSDSKAGSNPGISRKKQSTPSSHQPHPQQQLPPKPTAKRSPGASVKATPHPTTAATLGDDQPALSASNADDDSGTAEQLAAAPLVNPLRQAPPPQQQLAASTASSSPHHGLRGIRSAQQYSESIVKSEGMQLPGPALELASRAPAASSGPEVLRSQSVTTDHSAVPLMPEAAHDAQRTATVPHIRVLPNNANVVDAPSPPTNALFAGVPAATHNNNLAVAGAGAAAGASGSRFTFSWARAGSAGAIGPMPSPGEQVPAPNLPTSLLNPGYNNVRPPPVLPPTSTRPTTAGRQQLQPHLRSGGGLVAMASASSDEDGSLTELRRNSMQANMMACGHVSANDDNGVVFELGPPSSIDPNHGRSNSAAYSAFGGSNFSKAAIGLQHRITAARDGDKDRGGSFAMSRGSMNSGRGEGGMVVVVHGSNSSSRHSSTTSRSNNAGFITTQQVLSQYEAATAMLSREGFSRRRELVMTYMKKSTAARVRAWIDRADHGETALGPLTNPQLTAVTLAREARRDQSLIQFGPPMGYQTLLQLADCGGTSMPDMEPGNSQIRASSSGSEASESRSRRVVAAASSDSFRESTGPFS